MQAPYPAGNKPKVLIKLWPEPIPKKPGPIYYSAAVGFEDFIFQFCLMNCTLYFFCCVEDKHSECLFNKNMCAAEERGKRKRIWY